jgi:O-antigen/teichoic acid export membrane protein
MAVAFAPASPARLTLRQSIARRQAAMTRSALVTLVGHVTTLARPVAVAWFARRYGAASFGGFVLIWTFVELGARLATLGLDRGVQRWVDDRRAAATVAGMAIAGVVALALAIALCSIVAQLSAISEDTVPAAQLLLLVGLPLTAIGNVALRAAQGSTQIATYVLARGVTEPLLLLLAGLVVSPFGNGSVALPASLMISVVGGATVAAIGLVRTFGLRKLSTSVVQVRAWPMRELARTSLPLGLADLLQGAQAKLDLIVVAIVTLSASAIASYAIAAEVAAVFVAIRIGFDQIVAPLSADARGNRAELRRIFTTATRWSLMIAAPIGVVVLVSPEALLRWFGGSESAALVLLVLAAGRAVEMIFAPAASMLAIVGAPRLSLVDAATGVAIAGIGQLTAAVSGLGIVAIAVASATGMIASGLLALCWLVRLEQSSKPDDGRRTGLTAI